MQEVQEKIIRMQILSKLRVKISKLIKYMHYARLRGHTTQGEYKKAETAKHDDLTFHKTSDVVVKICYW